MPKRFWLASIAVTWDAAERALVVANPRFTGPADADDGHLATLLNGALDHGSTEVAFQQGDYDKAVAGSRPLVANYSVAPGQHLDLEPLCATACFTGDRLEVWAPTLAPEFARAAAASAAGMPTGEVTFYPTPVGGSSGRALEADAVPIAVLLAARVKRPVQLTIAAATGTNHDRMRPPLVARLAALPGANGTIAAWNARIVTGSGLEGALARLAGSGQAAADLASSVPPYGIPTIRIDRVAAGLPIGTGYMRGGHEGVASFLTESFIDEVARALGAEPLAFRIGMLGGNVRLAKAIMTAAAIGQWDGGASGSSMGLACASAFGSHIGLLAQAHIGPDQRIVVDKLVAAVDCGRAINPALVRQQVEGGLIAALGQATLPTPELIAGMPRARALRTLGLPRLAGTPKIEVELIPSGESPGGVSGLGSTVLTPALANALAAATGKRLRNLPFDATAA